jgi:predicted TIM-barrel enzyme
MIRAIAFALLGAGPASLAGEGLEYQVKAAFLFNFLKFVEWPASTPETPWVIGVLGRDPFGEVLDEIVRGKIVNGRGVGVRRYAKPEDVKDCNILFIGRGDYERTGVPSQVGLLTVGEAPGFLKSGGAISFYLEDNRVRFKIRPSVASAAGLRVSSQLLKLGGAL